MCITLTWRVDCLDRHEGLRCKKRSKLPVTWASCEDEKHDTYIQNLSSIEIFNDNVELKKPLHCILPRRGFPCRNPVLLHKCLECRRVPRHRDQGLPQLLTAGDNTCMQRRLSKSGDHFSNRWLFNLATLAKIALHTCLCSQGAQAPKKKGKRSRQRESSDTCMTLSRYHNATRAWTQHYPRQLPQTWPSGNTTLAL